MSVVRIPGTGKHRARPPAAARHRPRLPLQLPEITCLTALNYPTARWSMKPRGRDSCRRFAGMVVLGQESTLSVTIEEMLAPHARSAARRAACAPSWRTCPTGSYHSDLGQSLNNAVFFCERGGRRGRESRRRGTPAGIDFAA